MGNGQTIGIQVPDLILLSINQLMEGYSRQATPNTNNVVGFNNLQITCTKIETNPPTLAPTDDTPNPTPLPTRAPTSVPTEMPTKSPTTYAPTVNPTTAIPTLSPSKNPSVSPTRFPTFDPTENPTVKPSPGPVRSNLVPSIPTTVPSVNNLAQTLGGNSVCDGDFMTCNMQFIIVTIVLVIVCCLYWILGSVWYKRRQNNRPLPPHLMINKGDTEMQGTGQHATANKWKSAWELEQEAAKNNGGAVGGDAVMATGQNQYM